MTTLICWAALDARGPSALYIATDSRISWSSTAVRWDRGQKLTVGWQGTGILAFAGDVTFGQGLLLEMSKNRLADDQFEEYLQELSSNYPIDSIKETEIILARRDGKGMSAHFAVSTYKIKGRLWSATNHSMPTEHSEIIHACGSGKAIALDELKKWVNQDVSGRTSRSVFSAFCDALRSGRDQQTGGPPQLAAIYRSRPAQEIGVVWDNKLYLGGKSPPPGMNLASVKWHNDLFEVCDPATLRRSDGAQLHARPKILTGPI